MSLTKFTFASAFITTVASLMLALNSWTLMVPPEILLFAALTAMISGLALQLYSTSASVIRPDLSLAIVFFVFIFLILLYPVRNLELGDGIGLYINMARESLVFGYQLTIDELLEAWLHSKLFLLLGGHNTLLPYRILSSSAGLVFIVLFLVFIVKNGLNYHSALLLPGSGGILLFAGYAENYTLVTLVIFITVTIAYNGIRQNKTDMDILLPVAVLAALSALFHLVSGYLIFSLVFLAWISSSKNSFFKNSLYSGAAAIPVIALPIIYVMFFSDPLMDRTQAIVMNPPLYPFKRMLSANHIYEITGTMTFTALPALFTILYFLLFKRQELKLLLAKRENRFLLIVAAGFMVHAFIHNPQLGFPADWDLMSFYWLPLTLLAGVIITSFPGEMKYLLPVYLFAFLLNIFNFVFLSEPQPLKEKELAVKTALVHEYAAANKNRFNTISAQDKKFFLWADFFLYRTGEELKTIKGKQSLRLLEKNRKFRKELESAIIGNKRDDNWLSEYIRAVTVYHHEFLQLTAVREQTR